jgi:hypothetical protein
VKARYLAFLDDSGRRQYQAPYDPRAIYQPDGLGRAFWENNYFVMAALVVKSEDVVAIHNAIAELKGTTFGDRDIEIKSDWLRNPHQRAKYYLKPYHLDDVALNRFGQEVTELFATFRQQIKLCACVFDKRYYKNRKENDPCCNTCQVIFERIEFEMQRADGTCILVVDQMEDSLSPERGKNGEIRDVLLNRRRMKHTFIERYSHLTDIQFRESKRENLLQLADLAAYNIYRQFVDHGREWESQSEWSLYPYFQRIKDNFMHRNGQIRGIGLCKLPDIAKPDWRLKK